MRIAHINNISGVGSIIAKEQIKLGHKADVFVFDKRSYNQFGGIKYFYKSPLARWKFFRRIEKDYDIWHYHYPFGHLKRELERRRAINKQKIYLKHYHGNDLRGGSDHDFCLVSTPDLLKFAPNGEWLPNPVESDFIDKLSNEVKPKPNVLIKIAHYPYYSIMKQYQDTYTSIIRTLHKLEQQGKCKIVRILNLPHEDALRLVISCDIVLGKILPGIGWFGKFELEGMAAGKPVIALVDGELYDKYKPPVFRTSIKTFHDDLEMLIKDEQVRLDLSRNGREYVRRVHAPEKVCNKVLDIYTRLLH